MRLIISLVFAIGLATTVHAAEQTTILHIEAMMCGADPHIVQDSLTKLKGVDHVEISLEAKTAIVSFDNALVTVADLQTATGAAGYPATLRN
jgi:periplasmic mercuric ion binding protein